MSTPITSAPSWPASSAVRAPMPEATPVIRIVLPSSMVMRFRLSRLDGWTLLAHARLALATAPAGSRPAAAADRQRALDGAPQAARQQQREDQRRRAEPDQVPDAGRAEPRLDQEEDDGAEDRAFEAADAADQHHEDHVGGPLHAEIGLGLEGHGGGQPQRAGHADAEGGEHEQQPLGRDDAHADRGGGVLVVADRLDGGAGAAAQQRRTGCRAARSSPPAPASRWSRGGSSAS